MPIPKTKYSCPICHSFIHSTDSWEGVTCNSWGCKGKYRLCYVSWEGNILEPVIKPWEKSNRVQAVECVVCSGLHKVDSDTYIKVHGSIAIGDSTFIIKNENSNNTVFCRSVGCIKTIFKDLLPTQVLTFQDKPSYRVSSKDQELDNIYSK